MGQLENILKNFRNHKATLQDLGDIKILDFKNPNNNYWHIRYIFDESQDTLYITGDAGSLVARNYENMKFNTFNEFVNSSVDYFISKTICHSREFLYYDVDKMCDEIEKEVKQSSNAEARVKQRYGTLSYLKACIIKNTHPQHGLDEYWRDKLEEVYVVPELVEEAGFVRTAYPELYLRAFEMAVRQLKKGWIK